MQEGLLHRSHSILMVCNPILCYLSPQFFIFQESLIIGTWNKCHWIWHASNLNMYHSSHFDAFSQSKSTKCECFGCLLNSPYQKMKNHQFEQENSVWKAWQSAHIGFWVCWLQCTMLELCVISTFWVTMVFLDFWQEGLGISFWNIV